MNSSGLSKALFRKILAGATLSLMCLSSPSQLTFAELIDGGVSLSEALPPVHPSLRAGATFDQANLPAMGTTGGWYWIPSWAAGTWHREVMTYIAPNGAYQTQLSRVNHYWGQQIDIRSEIWQHHNEPYGEREDLPKWTEWKTVVLREPVQLTAMQMQMHFRATTVQVDRKTGKIRRSYQQEEMQILQPEPRGTMYQESWIKFFDEMGKPEGREHGVAHLTLIQPFQPVAVDPKTGVDLRQDFKIFLASHGYQYLVPEN
jgi:hypothetical protein